MSLSRFNQEVCHDSGIDPLTHRTWGRHGDEIVDLFEGKRPLREQDAREERQRHSWNLRGEGSRMPPYFLFAGAPTNAK